MISGLFSATIGYIGIAIVKLIYGKDYYEKNPDSKKGQVFALVTLLWLFLLVGTIILVVNPTSIGALIACLVPTLLYPAYIIVKAATRDGVKRNRIVIKILLILMVIALLISSIYLAFRVVELENKANELENKANKLAAEAAIWEYRFISSDPDNVSYSDSFNSVSDLISAIKKNPSYYDGKWVKVIGGVSSHDTFYTKDEIDEILASGDSESVWDLYLIQKITNGRYNHLKLSDDTCDLNCYLSYKQNIFIQEEDFIKLYGMIMISEGKISLNYCKYEMLIPAEEQ